MYKVEYIENDYILDVEYIDKCVDLSSFLDECVKNMSNEVNIIVYDNDNDKIIKELVGQAGQVQGASDEITPVEPVNIIEPWEVGTNKVIFYEKEYAVYSYCIKDEDITLDIRDYVFGDDLEYYDKNDIKVVISCKDKIIELSGDGGINISEIKCVEKMAGSCKNLVECNDGDIINNNIIDNVKFGDDIDSGKHENIEIGSVRVECIKIDDTVNKNNGNVIEKKIELNSIGLGDNTINDISKYGDKISVDGNKNVLSKNNDGIIKIDNGDNFGDKIIEDDESRKGNNMNKDIEIVNKGNENINNEKIKLVNVGVIIDNYKNELICKDICEENKIIGKYIDIGSIISKNMIDDIRISVFDGNYNDYKNGHFNELNNIVDDCYYDYGMEYNLNKNGIGKLLYFGNGIATVPVNNYGAGFIDARALEPMIIGMMNVVMCYQVLNYINLVKYLYIGFNEAPT